MSKTNGVWPKLASTTSPGVWSPTVGYKFDCNDNDTHVYYTDVGTLQSYKSSFFLYLVNSVCICWCCNSNLNQIWTCLLKFSNPVQPKGLLRKSSMYQPSSNLGAWWTLLTTYIYDWDSQIIQNHKYNTFFMFIIMQPSKT